MHSVKTSQAWKTTVCLMAALAILALAGCATMGAGSKALEWQQVNSAALGNERFNAIRVKTFGPYVQQLYGYFLYTDGTTVSVSGQMTGTPIGKMTLAEVQQDYQRVIVEDRLIARGDLIIRGVGRGDSFVGYSANMPMMNYVVWDMSPDAQGSNIVLLLTFR